VITVLSLARIPVGTRKVCRVAGKTGIVLGKNYEWLLGKKVLVEVYIILDEEQK